MGQFRCCLCLLVSLVAVQSGCASFPKMKMAWLPWREVPADTARAGDGEATTAAGKTRSTQQLTADLDDESKTQSNDRRTRDAQEPLDGEEPHDAALLKLIDEELADADATEKYEVYQRLKDVDPAAVPRLLRAEKLARQFANHSFESGHTFDRGLDDPGRGMRERDRRERVDRQAPDPSRRNPFLQDDGLAERRYAQTRGERSRDGREYDRRDDYAAEYGEHDFRDADRAYEEREARERYGYDDRRVASSSRERYSFPGDDYGHSSRPPSRSSDDYRRYYEEERPPAERRAETGAPDRSDAPLASSRDGNFGDFDREYERAAGIGRDSRAPQRDLPARQDAGRTEVSLEAARRDDRGVQLASNQSTDGRTSGFRGSEGPIRPAAAEQRLDGLDSGSQGLVTANGATAATLESGIAPLASPSVPPVNDSQWRTDLQDLISRAHAELTDLPVGTTEAEQHNYIAKHVYLRMLYFVAGQQERAMEPIPGAPAVDQEFWQQMFWAVANYFDTAGMPDGRDRATQTITQLRSAVQRLQENARLELHNVAFGHKISSFGDYERFERDTFSPGQPVLVYAEVSNFKSEPTADGRYRTVLKSTIEVYKAGPSGDLVKRIPFQATEDLCRNERQDYFHSYEFTIPQRISLGPHVLKLTVEDQLSQKVAEYTVNFTVE